MENRQVEKIVVVEPLYRGIKQTLVAAVFAPAVVVVIDVAPPDGGFELIPLHAGMQDVQDVVENLESRQLRIRPPCADGQMRLNVAVKIFQ